MSMHKQKLTDDERTGLLAHSLIIDAPSQLSDCFRLGMAWAIKKAEFNCIGAKQPTCEKTVYWVYGGEAGEKPIMARFNNYKQHGGPANLWQTLGHDDFSMTGTKWLEIKQPIVVD